MIFFFFFFLHNISLNNIQLVTYCEEYMWNMAGGVDKGVLELC